MEVAHHIRTVVGALGEAHDALQVDVRVAVVQVRLQKGQGFE
jgi:hypothetical protein